MVYDAVLGPVGVIKSTVWYGGEARHLTCEI